MKTKSETQAKALLEEIDETIDLVKRGKIAVPDDQTIFNFLLKGSLKEDLPEPSKSPTPPIATEPDKLALSELLSRFFDSIPEGSLEDNTLSTMRLHERHLLRILKPKLNVRELKNQQLQSYINKRAKEKTQRIVDKSVPKKKQKRVPVSATTIRKELVTLGSAWRWAIDVELLSDRFPNRGLRWPKTEEKPPFQTWEEIERQNEEGDLTRAEADALWDCLYLRQNEIAELLKYVEQNAR